MKIDKKGGLPRPGTSPRGSFRYSAHIGKGLTLFLVRNSGLSLLLSAISLSGNRGFCRGIGVVVVLRDGDLSYRRMDPRTY